MSHCSVRAKEGAAKVESPQVSEVEMVEKVASLEAVVVTVVAVEAEAEEGAEAMPKRVQLRGFCWSMMPHVVKIVRAVSVYLNTAWDLVTTSITSLEYFWWASCSYSSPKFTTPSVSTRRGDT